MDETQRFVLIKKAHDEASACNSSAEVHEWIDWFNKELGGTPVLEE